MPIVWKGGRMVGAEGRGVRLDFEPMPDEGVDALRMLRDGEYVGVLWFAPFSVYAEVVASGGRKLLDDYDDVETLVDAALEALTPVVREAT